MLSENKQELQAAGVEERPTSVSQPALAGPLIFHCIKKKRGIRRIYYALSDIANHFQEVIKFGLAE